MEKDMLYFLRSFDYTINGIKSITNSGSYYIVEFSSTTENGSCKIEKDDFDNYTKGIKAKIEWY